jgi:HEAT repeat protein
VTRGGLRAKASWAARFPRSPRGAAAYLLGELRARESAGDLAAALAGETGDLYTRLMCIEALGKLADLATGPALAAAAFHPPAWIQAEALLALAKDRLSRGGPDRAGGE